jgi:hypothetical protein
MFCHPNQSYKNVRNNETLRDAFPKTQIKETNNTKNNSRSLDPGSTISTNELKRNDPFP